jgi:GT2 family glycosyltransferase
MTDPRLGVVMITRNRPEVITTLERLSEIPSQPPVVVVDNGSTDGTTDLITSRFPRVQLLRLPANRGAAARNAGVAALERPYIAFCDDDVWWEPGSLTTGADLLDAHDRLAVITAKILVGDEQVLDPTCQEMAASPLPREAGLPGVPIVGFLAGATLVRRQAFLEAGGFEPRFLIGGEEQLLAMQLIEAGWYLAYVEHLVAHHHPSSRRGGDRQWMQRRNALWTTWMRRSPRRALEATLTLTREACTDPAARRALLAAGSGVVWALRRRQPLPRFLEDRLRMLENSA